MRVFDFGANWQEFSAQRLDQSRLDAATRSLQALLGTITTVQGRSFLDVGCGSGLFSIAAQQLGATNVIGVDINPRCLRVSETNHHHFSPQSQVGFRYASALDAAQLKALGQFDVVYAWGSLHHTGAMWQAITNVASRTAPGGTLVLAIYNRHSTSPIWKPIKWLYNQLPGLLQFLMACVFAVVIYIAKFLVTRRNPLDKERGMDFWYDVIDWIGGYPYEYATPSEVQAFVEQQGFALRKLVPAEVPTGCNEFVFERIAT